jgi:hypothetical protein
MISPIDTYLLVNVELPEDLGSVEKMSVVHNPTERER